MAAELRQEDTETQGIINGCWWPRVFAFQDATYKELESYVAFFETAAGQWYVKTGNAAWQQASFDAWIRVVEAGF